MKPALLFIICLIFLSSAKAQSKDNALQTYANGIEITTTDFNKLLPQITKPGHNPVEKLNLVFYWVYGHIAFDTERFLKTGSLQMLSSGQTLTSGKALCFEYNQLFDMACTFLKLPHYNIEGYVKYYGFKAGSTFDQSNHIWSVVFVDNKWQMVDLLWACGTLSIDRDDVTFKKRVHKEYLFTSPDFFINTHLPADPVWQFDNRPLSMAGFVNKEDGIDPTRREPLINSADSVKVMATLPAGKQKIRSAVRAYKFNPKNPQPLIVAYYNEAIDMINNPRPTRPLLNTAKIYLTRSKEMIMALSPTDNLKSLLPVCNKAIQSINTRLGQ